jgi:hypothetical protein
MATNLYLHNVDPGYTPATKRGAWDLSTAATIMRMDTSKFSGGIIASVGIVETSSSGTYDVLFARFVSGPLGAQTVAGTVNVIISVMESNALADFFWHLHIYVTTGDSDTVRGTLLTDYVESTTNEWGAASTTSGLALQSAQTLSSLAVSQGDRIVAEVGYIARNTSTAARLGTMRYGSCLSASILDVAPDLTVGGDGTASAGFLTFSQDLTWSDVIEARSYEQNIEVTYAGVLNEARLHEQNLEVVYAGVLNEARIHEQNLEVVYQNLPLRRRPVSMNPMLMA